ncbi:hypothetical protein BD324DRAFT_631543 [Kockovaella imperatae]|uniref:SGNH hydrolase-type esterase domain-containing protein n=1 Tax=Kockovaella imperatae TaxID=4999 RepID=A0A1Y1UE17_9TREE|nr:hypothetical protein BD324DRAFT_631543 [Kockovaella imperatae]ORX35756.1 hypothetical protein BD324DRAFT_631543 [Kockovaella imperatae]
MSRQIGWGSWIAFRRYQVLFVLLFAVGIFTLVQIAHIRDLDPWDRLSSTFRRPPSNPYNLDGPSLARASHLEAQCRQNDQFEEIYGRTNLRMSRAYEGSQHRLRELSRKVLRGERVSISTIGGSITRGHQVYAHEVWFVKLKEWLDSFWPNDIDIVATNGAVPASGSDYFSFCFPIHIPENSDLILVELAVNDAGEPEYADSMENLLRGLLDLPSKPAVILLEAMAFSNGGMGGGGGRMHLPVAQYYDVPVINQRHPLANHFARYPELVPMYFSQDYWGFPDMRHLNARGHRDLAALVSSLIKDVTCEMLAEGDLVSQSYGSVDVDPAEIDLEALDLSWPIETLPWTKNLSHGTQQIFPGMFNTPLELGLLPRLPVLEGWNPNLDHRAPAFHPVCYSTRAHEERFNLTPTVNEGWTHWVHPEHLDKPYLITKEPGARVSFEIETAVGVVKVYSLRSRSFGFGTAECWMDESKDKSVKLVGYWDRAENVGRFDTVASGLRPGKHRLTCQMLEETSDPEGGHEFRLISVMSL